MPGQQPTATVCLVMPSESASFRLRPGVRARLCRPLSVHALLTAVAAAAVIAAGASPAQACQQEVKKAKARNCSIVVMQPRTGKILAMAQYPTYSPGNPSRLATSPAGGPVRGTACRMRRAGLPRQARS